MKAKFKKYKIPYNLARLEKEKEREREKKLKLAYSNVFWLQTSKNLKLYLLYINI
jgi:hypothetical protein